MLKSMVTETLVPLLRTQGGEQQLGIDTLMMVMSVEPSVLQYRMLHKMEQNRKYFGVPYCEFNIVD